MTRLLLTLVLFVGASCATRARHLAPKLARIYGSCAITEVESTLMLGRPTAVLAPEFPDPMQWRRYVLADGSIVDIAAAEDPAAPPEHDPMDGRFYSWTGIWAIGAGRVQGLAAHRQRTHYLPSGHSAANAPRRYREYFDGLDLSRPVTIASIEADLALPSETWRNLPATIFPLYWFHYEVGGTFVAIGGMVDRTGRAVVDRPDGTWNKDAIVFSGYWRAGE